MTTSTRRSGGTTSPPPDAATAPGAPTAQTDRAFLAELFRRGEATRAQIARETGISKPTISEAATRLEKAGLIVPVGEVEPVGRGRAAVLYSADPSFGHSAAVVVERRHLVVRCVDLRGATLFEESSAADLSFRDSLGRARALLAESRDLIGTPRRHAAVSVAAPVDPVAHTVHRLDAAPLSGEVGDLREALGLGDTPATVIDNDVNWAAHAQAHRERAGTFLYVYLGAGIGSSLVIDGRLYRGANGTAGEIGHLPTAGGRPLLRELAESAIGSPDHSSIDVARALELFSGVPGPGAAGITDVIASAVTTATTVLDPGRIILGGPLSQAPALVDAIVRGVRENAVSAVDVALGDPDETSPVRGVTIAAVSGLQRLASLAAG